eukprot:gnl/MRDRNA2_/MRDRNA2_84187_c0_seq2.p1 gnl/MRDRNA2_/MRDRNA2_84187_c0~~gnl/MRDRNA2_/MRDRNA2_84187_c0_seq2.p1  ORF type:complete len:126 (-),score=41.81 gnl/MRDRNA2_/MRDRNA2_84187_c0_seq2:93-470(-)
MVKSWGGGGGMDMPMMMMPVNPMMMKMMMGGGGMMMGGRGGGFQGKKKWTFKADKEGENLGEFTGKLKSCGWKYGFIECEEAGKGDIFVHWEEVKKYKKGQTVKFTLVTNKEGKPQAIKLKSGLK